MSRTPLHRQLHRCLQLARLRRSDPEAFEQAAQGGGIPRRRFLQGLAASTALAAVGCNADSPDFVPVSPGGSGPRIGIVGAGMAGLLAAYRLQQSGLSSTLFEASSRTGGRVFSQMDAVGTGLLTELGGEFLDSIHTDMLNLVSEFGLELLDCASAPERLFQTTYRFGGVTYTEADVIAAFDPFVAQLDADYASLPDSLTFDQSDGLAALDIPLSDYIDTNLGASGLIRELLRVAYNIEYGREPEDQSALNLLNLIGTDTSNGFLVFGESDERFKIVGGNQRLPDLIASRLTAPVQLGHRLVRIRNVDGTFALSFDVDGGGTREESFDYVFLCLPFSLLRKVDLQIDLPAEKKLAIANLGYGTNAKLILGQTSRFWRGQGLSGNYFTDLKVQSGWDSSRLQNTTEGSLTIYLGGQPGLDLGVGTPEEQAALNLPLLDQVLPQAAASYNNRVARFQWPTFPWTLGSYACYRPGQYREFAGAEFPAVGNLYFAGEHCSLDYQGYINGAAETARRAVADLLTRLNIPLSPELQPLEKRRRRIRVGRPG